MQYILIARCMLFLSVRIPSFFCITLLVTLKLYKQFILDIIILIFNKFVLSFEKNIH